MLDEFTKRNFARHPTEQALLSHESLRLVKVIALMRWSRRCIVIDIMRHQVRLSDVGPHADVQAERVRRGRAKQSRRKTRTFVLSTSLRNVRKRVRRQNKAHLGRHGVTTTFNLFKADYTPSGGLFQWNGVMLARVQREYAAVNADPVRLLHLKLKTRTQTAVLKGVYSMRRSSDTEVVARAFGSAGVPEQPPSGTIVMREVSCLVALDRALCATMARIKKSWTSHTKRKRAHAEWQRLRALVYSRSVRRKEDMDGHCGFGMGKLFFSLVDDSFRVAIYQFLLMVSRVAVRCANRLTVAIRKFFAEQWHREMATIVGVDVLRFCIFFATS